MLKNLIIASESTNLFTTKRFMQEGAALKLKTSFINPFETYLVISNNKKQIPQVIPSLYMFRTTGIRFDDYDLLLASQYQNQGSRISNSLKALGNFRNKDYQLQYLQSLGLPIIETLVFRGKITEEIIYSIKKMSTNQIYVLKMNRGNGGIGVQIVRGLDSLLSILETFHAIKDQKILIQSFKEHKKEYRVLLTKNKVLGVVEKTIKLDDFRGNSNRSNGKLLLKPNSKILELAQISIDKSELDYAGIDIFQDNDEYKLFEINAIPGFKQIEELGKKNIARELLHEIIKDSQKY